MALLFSVALESHILDERILSLSRVFLNGQLAAASSHEIANKLSSMDLQFNNLHNEIRSFARSRQDLINQPDFVHFQEHLDLTIETTQNLKSTIEGFRRLMEVKEEKGPINVNTIIYQAKQQLLLLARRVKVEIHLDLDEDLPSIIGSIVAFQQVFLNIMLNAIQHMEKQPDVRRTLVIVSSHKKDESKNEPIEIRFRDTGPGIHKSLWEKIFTLGFTTRSGGSGLGLYIAQSLVEAMGGQIMVEESLISIGTTFLVKLPAESA
jgi:signal transduction histidine kinase